MTDRDAMGEAAAVAGQHATAIGFHLLAAASMALTRDTRADELSKALGHWRPLANAMSALERTAPNAAQKARDFADQTDDYLSRRDGR